MTFIQPNKNDVLINRVLILFTLMFVFGAVWIIVLYNSTVNYSHGISEFRKQFQEVQAENVELKEEIFGLFDSENSMVNGGLIKEKNPEYLEIDTKWSFASQY